MLQSHTEQIAHVASEAIEEETEEQELHLPYDCLSEILKRTFDKAVCAEVCKEWSSILRHEPGIIPNLSLTFASSSPSAPLYSFDPSIATTSISLDPFSDPARTGSLSRWLLPRLASRAVSRLNLTIAGPADFLLPCAPLAQPLLVAATSAALHRVRLTIAEPLPAPGDRPSSTTDFDDALVSLLASALPPAPAHRLALELQLHHPRTDLTAVTVALSKLEPALASAALLITPEFACDLRPLRLVPALHELTVRVTTVAPITGHASLQPPLPFAYCPRSGKGLPPLPSLLSLEWDPRIEPSPGQFLSGFPLLHTLKLRRVMSSGWNALAPALSQHLPLLASLQVGLYEDRLQELRKPYHGLAPLEPCSDLRRLTLAFHSGPMSKVNLALPLELIPLHTPSLTHLEVEVDAGVFTEHIELDISHCLDQFDDSRIRFKAQVARGVIKIGTDEGGKHVENSYEFNSCSTEDLLSASSQLSFSRRCSASGGMDFPALSFVGTRLGA